LEKLTEPIKIADLVQKIYENIQQKQAQKSSNNSNQKKNHNSSAPLP